MCLYKIYCIFALKSKEMEEALKLHNWPDELYKFRGRGGMAVYHHIELNIY